MMSALYRTALAAEYVRWFCTRNVSDLQLPFQPSQQWQIRPAQSLSSGIQL